VYVDFPNTRLGNYEIRSQIGAGGMGEVYLAHDTKLDRKVALKILPGDVAADEGRFAGSLISNKAITRRLSRSFKRQLNCLEEREATSQRSRLRLWDFWKACRSGGRTQRVGSEVCKA
jgi:serine/threonine protein kinase